MPDARCPVASLVKPMIVGPTKPPITPMELISAIPPGADCASRYVGGRDQYAITEPKRKNAHTHKIARFTTSELCNVAVAANKIAATMREPPTCQRRSRRRSELRVIRRTPTPPKAYGSADHQPIWATSVMPRSLIISGSQNVKQ